MGYGYVKVGAAVPKLKVADCLFNAEEIKKIISKAAEQKIKVLCFPELSITAYTCADLFFQETLKRKAMDSLCDIMDYSKDFDTVVCVGMPIGLDNQLFNCAVLFYKSKILGVVPKSIIPNENEFYEKRWFSPSDDLISDTVELCGQVVPIGSDLLFKDETTGAVLGLEICADLWAPVQPSSFQCLHGANIILNLSASNELIGKHEYRTNLVTQQSASCISGYVYTSAGIHESTTDLVFGGHCFICENGSVVSEGQRFNKESQLISTEIDIERIIGERQKNKGYMNCARTSNYALKYREIKFATQNCENNELTRIVNRFPFVPSDDKKRNNRCDEIFSIQVAGLAKRIMHIGVKKVVIGISGGLDSTLALLVCVKTYDFLEMNRKDIIGVTMPGFGTTDRTYNNSIQLMKSLGITVKEISIKDACIQHFKDIEQDINNHDLTYENAQARERTQILMDIAGKENGFVVGTGDLSELALGWATYNGDHMSMYGVNGGIPKTLIRYMVRWAALHEQLDESSKNILLDVLDTPVSPELIPPDKEGKISQITEDIVGPYELHDFYLYYVLRFGFSPSKIRFLANHAFKDLYTDEVIVKWLKVFYKRFFTQQFKRSCLPDGPKVGTICLSPRGDLRMPSDASFHLWLSELE